MSIEVNQGKANLSKLDTTIENLFDAISTKNERPVKTLLERARKQGTQKIILTARHPMHNCTAYDYALKNPGKRGSVLSLIKNRMNECDLELKPSEKKTEKTILSPASKTQKRESEKKTEKPILSPAAIKPQKNEASFHISESKYLLPGEETKNEKPKKKKVKKPTVKPIVDLTAPLPQVTVKMVMVEPEPIKPKQVMVEPKPNCFSRFFHCGKKTLTPLEGKRSQASTFGRSQ